LLCPSTETLRSFRIDPSARNQTIKEDTGASPKFLITVRIMVETPLYTIEGTKEISDGETERSGEAPDIDVLVRYVISLIRLANGIALID